MTASPIIVGLKWRFGACRSNSEPHGYQAFTTAFDEVIDLARLPTVGQNWSLKQRRSFDEACERFDTLFTGERVEMAAVGASLVRDLQSNLTTDERLRTVVSLLVDHSRSMSGLRMMSALLAVEGAVDALDAAGISTEILGFTTVGWKGGKSRRAWRWAGKPRNPGRLCDLRHLIYAAADQRTRSPWHLRMALSPDMLRENIDGEALLWAASRLDAAKWTQRVICLVSDGVPANDSTLLANSDQSLLGRHLEETE